MTDNSERGHFPVTLLIFRGEISPREKVGIAFATSSHSGKLSKKFFSAQEEQWKIQQEHVGVTSIVIMNFENNDANGQTIT